jgi:hypothetical protein
MWGVGLSVLGNGFVEKMAECLTVGEMDPQEKQRVLGLHPRLDAIREEKGF